jgi:hypothetical protein
MGTGRARLLGTGGTPVSAGVAAGGFAALPGDPTGKPPPFSQALLVTV